VKPLDLEFAAGTISICTAATVRVWRSRWTEFSAPRQSFSQPHGGERDVAFYAEGDMLREPEGVGLFVTAAAGGH
jgi:hypothetical protein